MSEDELLTMKINRKTAERLKVLGKMGESYDDVINMLMDKYEKKVK